MKTLITILFLFLTLINGQAQDYRTQQRQVFAYNILINGIISGVGGAMNKSKEEKVIRVFLKNFGKGCIGGLVKYSAKSQTYYLNNPQNTFFAPINRLYFFVGQSIVKNASSNKKMLDSYYCNFYGIEWRVKILESKDRFSARLSLGTLFSVATLSFQGNKMDLKKTLQYGQFYFDLNPETYRFTGLVLGTSLYNTIAISKFDGESYNNAIPHEIVHTYQNYDLFCISSIYRPKIDKIYRDNKVYKNLAKFLYLDYEAAFFTAAYHLQPKPTYYKNFYEFEAEHFNSRAFVPR